MTVMPVVGIMLVLVTSALLWIRMIVSRVAGSLRTVIHTRDDGAAAPILHDSTLKTTFGHQVFALSPICR